MGEAEGVSNLNVHPGSKKRNQEGRQSTRPQREKGGGGKPTEEPPNTGSFLAPERKGGAEDE